MKRTKPARVGTRKRAKASEERTAPVTNPAFTKLFFTSPSQLAEEAFDRPMAKHALIYACIRAIATNIGGVPWLVRQGNRKESKVIETGPVAELFAKPNPILPVAQFKEAIITYLLENGECWCVKEARGNSRLRPSELPAELWPTNGRCYEAKVSPSTQLVQEWELVKGTRMIYQSHEIIPFKLFNPYNLHRGLAPMEAAESKARVDFKLDRYTNSFLDNDGTPGGILSSPEALTGDNRREIRERWHDQYGGPDKKGRVAVLANGMTWQSISAGIKDLNAEILSRMNSESILAVFGVPKAELFGEEGGALTTGAGVSIRDRNFWTKKLLPLMTLVEDYFYEQLFIPAGLKDQWVAFDRDSIEALRENADTKLATAKSYRDLGFPLGAISEKLQLEMEPVPLLEDVSFLPSGLIPAEQVLLELEPDPAPAATAVEDEDEEEEAAEASESAPRLALRRSPKKDAAASAVLKTSMEPFEGGFRGKWRRFLFEMGNSTLKALKLLKKDFRAEDPGPLPDPKTWNNRLTNLTRPVYGKVLEASLGQVFKELGGNFAFDVQDPRVLDIVEARQRVLIQASEKVRRAVARQLEQGQKAGESLDQLAERVKNVFKFSQARSLTIARTEVASAANQARNLAFEEEGVEEHEWVTAKDEAVRDSHAEQDGVVVKVGESFPNGLRFPSDPGGAPGEVINCRCVAVAV